MRLKLFEHLEEEIVQYSRGRKRLKRMEISPAPHLAEERCMMKSQCKAVVDYRIRVGARQVVPDTDAGRKRGREKVSNILARHLYDDLHSELIDLWEWACDEGIGADLEEKLERLIKLTRGDDV